MAFTLSATSMTSSSWQTWSSTFLWTCALATSSVQHPLTRNSPSFARPSWRYWWRMTWHDSGSWYKVLPCVVIFFLFDQPASSPSICSFGVLFTVCFWKCQLSFMYYGRACCEQPLMMCVFVCSLLGSSAETSRWLLPGCVDMSTGHWSLPKILRTLFTWRLYMMCWTSTFGSGIVRL